MSGQQLDIIRKAVQERHVRASQGEAGAGSLQKARSQVVVEESKGPASIEILAEDPLIKGKRTGQDPDPFRESLVSLDEDQKNFLGVAGGNQSQNAP